MVDVWSVSYYHQLPQFHQKGISGVVNMMILIDYQHAMWIIHCQLTSSTSVKFMSSIHAATSFFSCIGTINKVNSLSHSSKIQWWLIVFGVMKDLTNSGWLLMHDKPMHYLQNHPSNYQHWTTSVCCQSRSVQFLSSYQIPPQWHHYQQAVCRWCGCTRWQYGWTYEVLRVRKVWRRECGRDRQLL